MASGLDKGLELSGALFAKPAAVLGWIGGGVGSPESAISSNGSENASANPRSLASLFQSAGGAAGGSGTADYQEATALLAT